MMEGYDSHRRSAPIGPKNQVMPFLMSQVVAARLTFGQDYPGILLPLAKIAPNQIYRNIRLRLLDRVMRQG
jgi:hypothetical protein